MKARQTSRTLRNREFVRHLVAGSVAFSALPVWLPDEAEGEASFSVYKTNNPAELNQPFLLIACTGRIVTRSMNCSGYRQILRVSSIWPDAHRTVTDAEGSESTLGSWLSCRHEDWTISSSR